METAGVRDQDPRSFVLSEVNPSSLPGLGVLMSLLFWVVDSMIDVVVFGESESIIESLFSPEPVELWMRTLVCILFLAFSFYARHVLNHQIHITEQLDRYRNDLEDMVKIRTSALEEEIAVRKKTENELLTMATTDPLTGLFNRRRFSELMNYEIDRQSRHNDGLSLILCDIDYFKAVNDRYGHNTGDKVLIDVARLVKQSVRETDVVARWGGEEFIILLPNTDLPAAVRIAEKLRSAVEDSESASKDEKMESLLVTASFGVASLEQDDDGETFIGRADQLLYQAKMQGRNRVEADSTR